MYQTSSPCSCQPQRKDPPSVSPKPSPAKHSIASFYPLANVTVFGLISGGNPQKIARNHKKPQSIKKLKKDTIELARNPFVCRFRSSKRNAPNICQQKPCFVSAAPRFLSTTSKTEERKITLGQLYMALVTTWHLGL